jgi:hypothetical protein
MQPRTTTHNILRVGYYWSIVFVDVHSFVRACQPCQLFAGRKHLVALPL